MIETPMFIESCDCGCNANLISEEDFLRVTIGGYKNGHFSYELAE